MTAVAPKKFADQYTCHITGSRVADVRFLEVVVALEIKEFEQRRPKLTSRER